MKKFLALVILLVTAACVPSVQAKSSGAANSIEAPQIRVQIGRGRRNDRVFNQRRVTTQVRNVRVGRQLYRETYRVVYRPNGTTRTQLVSRVRINRY